MTTSFTFLQYLKMDWVALIKISTFFIIFTEHSKLYFLQESKFRRKFWVDLVDTNDWRSFSQNWTMKAKETFARYFFCFVQKKNYFSSNFQTFLLNMIMCRTSNILPVLCHFSLYYSFFLSFFLSFFPSFLLSTILHKALYRKLHILELYWLIDEHCFHWDFVILGFQSDFKRKVSTQSYRFCDILFLLENGTCFFVEG